MKKLLLLACLSCSPAVERHQYVKPDAGEDLPDSGKLSFDNAKPNLSAMKYRDGEVFINKAHVYTIWYGAWSERTISLIDEYIDNFDSSDYFKINTQYYQVKSYSGFLPEKKFVTGFIERRGEVYDFYSQGYKLDFDLDFKIITSHIENNDLPLDNQGIYLVFVSGDVKEGTDKTGLCKTHCGWHNNKIYKNTNLIFSYLADASSCGGCNVRDHYKNNGYTHSPNYDWAADAIISVMSHEISEILTDPYPTYDPLSTSKHGWIDVDGNENADKCAWTFGDLFVTENNSIANITVGHKDYLVQQNFVLSTNKCGLTP